MWPATFWHRQWPRSPGDEQSPVREGRRMCRGALISMMRRQRMITGVGLVCVFVLDMDEGTATAPTVIPATTSERRYERG